MENNLTPQPEKGPSKKAKKEITEKVHQGAWLTEFALDKNRFFWVLLVMAVVVGIYSYFKIPKEWTPDVKIPFLIIATPYRGASPIDSETLITKRLEREFQGIKGMKTVKSTSTDGVSIVTLEFESGVNLQDAKNQVRDSIDKARPDLPTDADPSQIIEINFSELPFYILNMASKLEPDAFRLVSDDIKEDIEGIPGVLKVKKTGGVQKEMQLYVDPDKLNYYNISLNQVIRAVAGENLNAPSGTVNIGPLSVPVRMPGEKQNAKDFAEIVVSAPGQKLVHLSDLASKVEFGNIEQTSISRLGGADTITLSISKRSGENLQRITDDLQKVVTGWDKKLNGEVKFSALLDQSVLVTRQLDDLQNNLILGFLLVVLVLYLVMGFMNSILVAFAIPLSMLMGIIILKTMGITLNLVVLFSLVMALGLVVDDAIVVVENVYRHLQMGRPTREALRIAIGEIASPVTTSTLTTLASFFPLLFVPGIIGDFMKYLPISLIATLTSSLWVALVFNPLLCSKVMHLPKNIVHGSHENEIDSVKHSRVLQFYGRVINWALDRSYWVIGGIFLLFVAVAFLYFGVLKPGVEFFPKDEPSEAYIDITAPYGSNLAESERIVKQVEKIIQPYIQYTTATVVNIGASRTAVEGDNTPFLSYIYMGFPNWQHRTKKPSEVVRDMQAELDKKENQIPGAKIAINLTTSGPPAAKPVNLEISGPDLFELKDLSNQVQGRIRGLKGLINLDDDLTLNVSNIEVVPKADTLARYNLRNEDIALALRTAVSGNIVTKYKLDKDQYNVMVRYPENLRKSIDDIRNIPVYAQGYGLIVLQNVADVRLGISPGSIRHVGRERTVTVSADALGVSGANLLIEVRAAISDLKLPPGYKIAFTGENERQGEVQNFIPLAFLAAIFLIYMIMVWEFNSVTAPIVVLTTVFLSLIGVLLGLSLHYKPFSILMGGIAVVSLAGVVVKNGIVLLDYIHYKRLQGMNLREAIVLSGMLRVRPIILTASTAILALVPTLWGMDVNFFRWPNIISFSADGGEIWKPLANAMTYGLLVSTTLTLVFVPCFYYKVESWREKWDAHKARKHKKKVSQL